MTHPLDEVRIKLLDPKVAKYQKYMKSFWTLTKDEQDRVEAKHSGVAEYLRLFRIEMSLMTDIVTGQLQVGNSGLGLALQVEDLSETLNKVTFDASHLRRSFYWAKV